MRNNAPVEHYAAERFYVIGNEVSYDIKKAPGLIPAPKVYQAQFRRIADVRSGKRLRAAHAAARTRRRS